MVYRLDRVRPRCRLILAGVLVWAMLHACSSEDSSGSTASRSPSSVSTTTPAWYEGGTLHDAGALEWQDASYSDKLATCADIIAIYDSEGYFLPSIADEINTINDIRPYAEELVTALDAAFERDPDPERNRAMYADQDVAGAAVITMGLMGWSDV